MHARPGLAGLPVRECTWIPPAASSSTHGPACRSLALLQRAFYVLPVFVFLTFFMISVSNIATIGGSLHASSRQGCGACGAAAGLDGGFALHMQAAVPSASPTMPHSLPTADLRHQGGRLPLQLGEHPLQQGGWGCTGLQTQAGGQLAACKLLAALLPCAEGAPTEC